MGKEQKTVDELGDVIDNAVQIATAEVKIIPKKPPRKKQSEQEETVFYDPCERVVLTIADIEKKWTEKNKNHKNNVVEVSPVQAIGKHGLDFYFLDADNQMIVLKASQFNAQNITALFGKRTGLMDKYWPRYGADGSIKQWDTKDAYGSLMASCSVEGTINPSDLLRGTGAWLHEDKLIIHTGKAIYHDGHILKPGKIGKYVYPSSNEVVIPEPQYCPLLSRGYSESLLAIFKTWNWERGSLDALLLLGYVAASMIGGALKVRPLVWITGERGCGKSRLTGGSEGVIPALFNRRIIATANTTAAGLYQSIGYSSLPVAVDEIEAKADSKTAAMVIELARQSFSGGVVLRGGAEHSAFSFTARCSFLFSSINIPPLMPQDISRTAVLRLNPLKEVKNLDIQDDYLYKIGGNILAIWSKEFENWSQRLSLWQKALADIGHDSRACDQFGTLLAAADFVLNQNMPNQDYIDAILKDMKPEQFAETGSSITDSEQCLMHLMSQRLDAVKSGAKLSVNEYVTAAVYGDDAHTNTTGMTAKDALNELNRNGISVLMEDFNGDLVRADKAAYGRRETAHLAIARQGEIIKLFENSDWAGKAGASNPHTQSLMRFKNAKMSDNPIRFGGGVSRSTLIPLENTHFFFEFSNKKTNKNNGFV